MGWFLLYKELNETDAFWQSIRKADFVALCHQSMADTFTENGAGKD